MSGELAPKATVIEVSTRQVVAFFAALLGVLAASVSVFSALFLPMVMEKVDERIDTSIAYHEDRPHRGAADKGDLDQILRKIDELPTRAEITLILQRQTDLSMRINKMERSGG